MLSKAKTLMLGVAAIAAMSTSVANATPYVWSDTYNPSDILIGAGQSIGYQHNITDGANGYQPGVDSVTSAFLTIWLYDDAFLGDSWFGDAQESVKFSFDGFSWTSNVDGNSVIADVFNFSLGSLLSDGIVNVSLRGQTGDFMFDKSLLTVYGNNVASTSVPEPASLALFGLGLLGVGVAGKRKAQKAA